MANYNIDIGVKVQSQQLDQFNKKLRSTETLIKNANKSIRNYQKGNLEVVKSINGVNEVLNRASKNFREVAVGTPQATRAAKEFVKAEQLVNKTLAEQEKLLENTRRKQQGKEFTMSIRSQGFKKNQIKQSDGSFINQRRAELQIINRAATLEDRINQTLAKRGKMLSANGKQIINNNQARGRRAGQRRGGLGSTASSAIIGGSFPLLFGQTGAAAVGGGIGGAAGGLIGGQFGFALSIFGTAIGSAVDRAEKFNKSLVELNQRMGITGGATAISAKEVNSLAKSLNITKEEVFGVLGAFQEFGSGEIAKSMAMIFGGDAGGVDRFAGLDRSAKLAQEIFNARKQIGNEAAKNLLIQNQTNDAAVIELALVKAKAKAEQDAAIARVKAVSAFDQIRANTPGLLIRRLMGNMKVTDYGDIRAENLQKKFAEDNITLLENYKKGIIEARELLELLRESQGQFGVSGTLQFTAITDKVKDLQDEMKALQNPIKAVIQVSDLMATSFEDSFKGIIKGTMTVADAFRNMLNKMADYFLDTAARMMANQLQQGLLGLLGNIFLRNPYGVKPGQSLYDVPTPSRFTDMTGGARANGGPVKGGSSYLVGERGPEMFSPGVSGTITPNHALVGSTNIVVNVDATGSSVEGDEQRGRELGALISAAIQSELINEKRPGGLLA